MTGSHWMFPKKEFYGRAGDLVCYLWPLRWYQKLYCFCVLGRNSHLWKSALMLLSPAYQLPIVSFHFFTCKISQINYRLLMNLKIIVPPPTYTFQPTVKHPEMSTWIGCQRTGLVIWGPHSKVLQSWCPIDRNVLPHSSGGQKPKVK